MLYLRLICGQIISTSLLILTLSVHAEEKQSTQSPEKWQFGVEAYLWGASIDVKPTGGDTVHVSFSDIWDDLEFAFMSTLSARKGKWSFFADIIYMDLDDDDKGSAALIGLPGITTKIDVEVEAWIVTAAGAYTVMERDRFSLDLLAGARYLYLDVPLKFRIGPIKRKVSPDGTDWNGIIGVKGKVDFSDKWYLNYYADMGTGDSDFTWQGLAGLNYKFKKVNAVAGYRYLDFDIEGSEVDDLTIDGPFAGVKFYF